MPPTEIYRVRMHDRGDVFDYYFARHTDAFQSVAANELAKLRAAHTDPADTDDGYNDGYGELADKFEKDLKAFGAYSALAWLGRHAHESHGDGRYYLKRVETIRLELSACDLNNDIPSLVKPGL